MVDKPRSRPGRYRGERQPMRIDEYLKRWIKIHASRNHWRVAHWMDLDDLIQDGLVLWLHVATRYKDTVSERAHMVSLFQTSYIRHVHALANKRTAAVTEVQWTNLMASSDGEDVVDEPACLSDNGDGAAETELRALLAKAPEPLRKLLDFFEHGEVWRLTKLYRRRYGGLRETFNERLARLTGQVGEDGSVPDFRKLLEEALKT